MRISITGVFVLIGMWIGACSFDVSGLHHVPKGCGNGVLEEAEACDDGNQINQDGCDAQCRVESGWNCTAALCHPICGDGRIVGLEPCDDGNLTAQDGCDAECRVEPGWSCEDMPSSCTTRCGDGIRAGQELCDDGNLDVADGCNDVCNVETGFACEGSAPTVCSPVCGDNRVVAGEVCDRINLNGQTCESRGYYQGTLSCMSDCQHFDEANCSGKCGDHILDFAFGEACDQEAFNSNDSCVSAGYPGGELTCSNQCELNFDSCNHWVEIATGDGHTCALRTDGSVWCWGNNSYGQLGQNPLSVLRSLIPLEVPSRGAVVTRIATGYHHTCAVLVDKTLWCWGHNSYGQLGNGNIAISVSLPVQVQTNANQPLERIAHITAGEYHTCALTDTGAVYCWGSNTFGQLGDGTDTPHAYATEVPQLTSNVTGISAGRWHTCVLKNDGTAWCWGSNTYGQVGVEQVENQLQPTTVNWGSMTVPSLVSVSCGEYFTCVASNSGNAYCFGQNTYGQLGNGKTIHSSRPVTVELTNSVVHIASGSMHACAVFQNGKLFCWGANFVGQLGDGTLDPRTIPVQVLTLVNVQYVEAGVRHTCAIENGKLFCWGGNSNGQIGNNTYTNQNSPSLVDVSNM